MWRSYQMTLKKDADFDVAKLALDAAYKRLKEDHYTPHIIERDKTAKLAITPALPSHVRDILNSQWDVREIKT